MPPTADASEALPIKTAGLLFATVHLLRSKPGPRPVFSKLCLSDETIGSRFGGALGAPLYHAGASLILSGTIEYQTDVAMIDDITDDLATNPSTRADFDDRVDVGGKRHMVFPLR